VDSIDREILHELSKNGRATLQSISEKVGISRVAIAKRLEKLIENNIIGIHAMINIKKLDYKVLKVEADLDEKSRKLLLKRLKNCPRVIFATEITGEYNFELFLCSFELETIKMMIEKIIKPYCKKIRVTLSSVPEIPHFIYLPVAPIDEDIQPCGEDCKECSFKELCLCCQFSEIYKFKKGIEGGE